MTFRDYLKALNEDDHQKLMDMIDPFYKQLKKNNDAISLNDLLKKAINLIKVDLNNTNPQGKITPEDAYCFIIAVNDSLVIFLNYLENLTEDECQKLRKLIDLNYEEIKASCGKISPVDLLNETITLIKADRHQTYPLNLKTSEDARQFIISVIINLVTFLNYLQNPTAKEYKLLLAIITPKYWWVDNSYEGQSPVDLISETFIRIKESKRKTYPRGIIIRQEARSYFLQVVRSIASHTIKKHPNERDNFTSTDKLVKGNLEEIILPKVVLEEIRNRIKNSHPDRQPRITEVFDHFVLGFTVNQIVIIVASNKSTIYEDIKIIRTIIRKYIRDKKNEQ